MEIMSIHFLTALGTIVLMDILLGGDNAVVIAMAANKLPHELRKKAIFIGTAGAVIIRLIMTFAADVESEFELGIGETVAIHVKETNPGVFKCVPFGEGTVRFTDIFKKLKELNYTGMFLIEMWADNTKKQTMEEAVEVIKKARLFVEDKMEQAGIKVPA